MGDTDYDLCSRWMSLSAFFPFYKNHNVKAMPGQYAYRWSSVAGSAHRKWRSLLKLHVHAVLSRAYSEGVTIMRALAQDWMPGLRSVAHRNGL